MINAINYCMRKARVFLIKVSLLFLFFLNTTAYSTTLSDPRFCSDFLKLVGRANIGRGDNPVRVLQESFGKQIYDRGLQKGLFELENDVQELFMLAPALRDMNEFAQKWNFKPDQALDVLTYYGTHIYNDLRVAGDLRTVVSRLRAVAKQHYLDTHPSLKERQVFYVSSITRLSVPEMAMHLGLSEGQVYHELALLELSIADAFSKDGLLAKAQRLLGLGQEVSQIAEQLHVGEQALCFFLHFKHEAFRGAAWNRTFAFEDGVYSEIELTVLLKERFYNAQQIADAINGLADEKADSPNFRTAASVQAKLAQLGLTTSRRSTDTDDLYHPQYGYLKENGRLITTSVVTFLMDHYTLTDEELANLLEIPIDRLQKFMQLHYFFRSTTDLRQASSNQTAALLNGHKEQMAIMEKMLAWVENHGTTPTLEEIGLTAHRGMRFFKLFPSRDSAWLAFKLACCASRGGVAAKGC